LKNLQSVFYSFIKSKQKIRSCIGPLEKADGSLTSDDQDVAETLNIFFEPTFTREDLSNVPSPSFRNEESISCINITEATVYEKLCKLKANKALGPDGLHSYVLKSCACTICVPLTMLYSQSLSSGELPDK